VTERYRAAEADIAAIEGELRRRAGDAASLAKVLEAEENDEPVLFGKDTWNARVAELRSRLSAVRNAEAQRTGTLNQLRMELASLSVDVKTEQQQVGLAERSIQENRAKEQAILKSLRELDKRLGSARPTGWTAAQAEQNLRGLEQQKRELAERLGKLRAEVRGALEQKAKSEARLAQIRQERQHAQALVHSAQVAVTQGREEAARQLAAERRSAVERHVGEVLGSLEKSLTSVDPVFIEPAREVLRRAREGAASAAAVVAAEVEKVEPVIQGLVPALDQELLAQEAMLSQIQREFCEAAPAACRAAWG
jgi:chromosome segregation ATPase